jgi:SAM-dependent methyltransferase
MRDAPEVDFTGVATPLHLSREMLSYFPRALGEASFMLDLGCGAGMHRGVAERSGFHYVGIDHDERSGANVLADAHALPFKDASFEFVLSIAVLEHIRFPLVMLHEARRVLRPGGKLIGTVSFLEPFHGDSYYHHTHLGALNALEASGFRVERIAPIVGWSALLALANLALFPRLPIRLAQLLVLPLQVLHRLWWWLGGLLDTHATEEARLVLSAGAFTFIATKP